MATGQASTSSRFKIALKSAEEAGATPRGDATALRAAAQVGPRLSVACLQAFLEPHSVVGSVPTLRPRLLRRICAWAA